MNVNALDVFCSHKALEHHPERPRPLCESWFRSPLKHLEWVDRGLFRAFKMKYLRHVRFNKPIWTVNSNSNQPQELWVLHCINIHLSSVFITPPLPLKYSFSLSFTLHYLSSSFLCLTPLHLFVSQTHHLLWILPSYPSPIGDRWPCEHETSIKAGATRSGYTS